jgi:hypothetical protein
MSLPTPNTPSAKDGTSSSPHPHHPPPDADDDEASGTSFDDLLAATIADGADTLDTAPSTAPTTAPTTGPTNPIVDPSQPVIAADITGVTTASSDYVASSTGI